VRPGGRRLPDSFVASWCSLLGVLLSSGAPAASPGPRVTALVPLALHSGANPVSRLAPDGRDGLIVLGWRENGNAHGYDLALVLLRDKAGTPFKVVRVDRPGGAAWSDGITDDPHTGEDMVSSFRFARGRIDGRPATLLLVATRDAGETIPDPSRVTFEIYAMEHAPEVGTTPDHFRLIAKERSDGPYCNADMALARRFDLPLGASYAGARTASGCP
jgi:hypothetical protein